MPKTGPDASNWRSRLCLFTRGRVYIFSWPETTARESLGQGACLHWTCPRRTATCLDELFHATVGIMNRRYWSEKSLTWGVQSLLYLNLLSWSEREIPSAAHPQVCLRQISCSTADESHTWQQSHSSAWVTQLRMDERSPGLPHCLPATQQDFGNTSSSCSHLQTTLFSSSLSKATVILWLSTSKTCVQEWTAS